MFPITSNELQEFREWAMIRFMRVVVATFCVFSMGSAQATQYEVTLLGLGTLEGASSNSDSSATGINESGQVVGTATIAGTNVAILWSGATVTNLGGLGGPSAFSVALGINDSGQVVGFSRTIQNDPRYYATLWSEGAITNLGFGYNSTASAINNTGQIAVSSSFGSVVWAAGTVSYLSFPHVSDSASGINDKGQVVGAINTRDGLNHAALWSAGITTDLGTLGATWSVASAINDFSQIVGYSYNTVSLTYQAILWDVSDAPKVIGSFEPAAINNRGQVVGTSGSGAVLWNDNVTVNLNQFLDAVTVDAGWVLAGASGINDKGQITGTAFNNHTGLIEAFLLTPVPEPATIALLTLGLASLAATRRSKHK